MTSSEDLDTYLNFLDTSSSCFTDKDPLPTPRIDTIIQSYKLKSSSQTSESCHGDEVGPLSYESRLVDLEKQLTTLLAKSKASPYKDRGVVSLIRDDARHRSTAGHTDSQADEEEDLSGDSKTTLPDCGQLNEKQSSRNTPKLIESRRTRAASTVQSSRQATSRPKKPTSRLVSPCVTNQSGSASFSRSHLHKHTNVSTPDEDQKTKTKLMKVSKTSDRVDSRRERIQTLTDDLETEKVRCWKAEQAAEHLVSHVRTLQRKLTDVQAKHELCVVNNAHLQDELKQEKGTVETLQAQLKQVRDGLEANKEEIKKARTREDEQMNILRTLEENCRQFETEKLQERSEFMTQVGEAETKALGYQKEAELVSKGVRHLKVQLQQSHELLANREREHHEQLESCKPMDNKIQEMIAREVRSKEMQLTALLDQQREKISEQQKAYQSLEDEFRMALRIEMGRFQELQGVYEQVSADVDSSRETAIAAVQKEHRASSIIMELTALVKEQKGRLEELGRSKKESLDQLKERVAVLEKEQMVKNKLELKLQSLQEENSHLSSKVLAQDSVVEGLREERQLWGKELAYQGASLAQDRGKLEARVESLLGEVQSTREQLQKEREVVRIREKQVEDQLQTIHQLKQSLSGKERDVETLQLDWQREEQALQLQLDREQTHSLDMQEQLSGLVERKEALKDELATSQDKLEQWKLRYNKLKTQWDAKMDLLTSLEGSMEKLQQTFSEKETKLSQDKDDAIEEARGYQQRLKQCDDAFREQLEAKQRSHDNHMMKITSEKDREIHLANQKVASVEEEMRHMLHEVTKEKQVMETKFQKLLRAFQEMREDFSD